jgi:metal-sulfur cluster biosynthetic enzyme
VTDAVGAVQSALGEVLDPEYPVSLVDMGMIRGVEVEDATARVSIAYCSLGCPCIALIEQDVEERLLQVVGIDRVQIVESFDPWTRKDLSQRGLAVLRDVGIG